MSWVQEGLCGDESLDPDIFFPDPDEDTEEEQVAKIKVAKQYCIDCPVATQCFELGMRPENRRWGIFGGLTVEERRYLAQKGNSK